MKFKKGDKVKIVNNNKLPSFNLNEEVEIVMADPLSEILPYFAENNEGVGCWVNENEVRKE